MVYCQESYCTLKLGLLFVYAWWLLTLYARMFLHFGKVHANKHEEEQNKHEGKESKLEEERNLLEYLPKVILLQILERLPTKSLFQLVLVSKNLHSFIKNSINFRPKVLVTFQASMSLSSIDNQSRVENVHLNLEYRPSVYTKLKCYGSCNGFVLLNAGTDFYFWNPLTKYTEKLLLRSRLEKVRLKAKVADPFISILVLGLCHNSYADEYKVVMVARDNQGRFVRAYVFVVDHEAVYRTTVDLDHYALSFRIGPVIKGNLHSLWGKSAMCEPASRESIIAFNPRVDQFSDIPMPEPKDGGGDILAGMGVLGGCLCIARFESPVNKYSNIEIVVMREYGEGTSWTVMCSIRNYNSFGYIRTLVPLCYINNNEALMHVNDLEIKALNFAKNSLNEVTGCLGSTNTVRFFMKRTGVDLTTEPTDNCLTIV